MNPTLEDVQKLNGKLHQEWTEDDYWTASYALALAERVLLAQSQGGKMLPPDIATEKADIRRLYMTMHQNTPDLLEGKAMKNRIALNVCEAIGNAKDGDKMLIFKGGRMIQLTVKIIPQEDTEVAVRVKAFHDEVYHDHAR